MQPHGTRTPIFALSGHNGDVFAFQDLVRHLGNEQPFYGLEPPGLDGSSEPFARVEDLAAYLAPQIRACRPQGPYIIAGYCAGGAAAFELARQMLQAGDDVRLLALFGCPHPTLYRFDLAYWARRVHQHAQVVTELPSFGERREYVAERIRARLKQLREERAPSGSDPVLRMRARFQHTTIAAARRYAPRRFAGRVCLFIPHRQWLRANGAALRWRSVAPHAEEHYGPDSVDAERMLLDPHAAVFAKLVERVVLQRHAY
jgi:thioesterase domain-containing protein